MKSFCTNRALRILLCTNGLVLMAGAMLAPIYALFVDELGGDILDAGIAGALFALSAGVTTLLSGRWSDSVTENELIVVLGYAIMGIGFLLYVWVDSVWFLFCVQVVIGLGEAIYAPAFDAVYSKHIDASYSGSQWGIWESMNYFVAAAGAIAGGGVVTLLGFPILFIIMSVLCFGSALYIYGLKRSVL